MTDRLRDPKPMPDAIIEWGKPTPLQTAFTYIICGFGLMVVLFTFAVMILRCRP